MKHDRHLRECRTCRFANSLTQSVLVDGKLEVVAETAIFLQVQQGSHNVSQ